MSNNCFAYGNRGCKILKEKQCNINTCSFYKTKEEQEKSINKAFKRISSLDTKIQRNIADIYFEGNYPWLEV